MSCRDFTAWQETSLHGRVSGWKSQQGSTAWQETSLHGMVSGWKSQQGSQGTWLVQPNWLHSYNEIFNTLRPRQNGRHIADDTFKCIFLFENVWIWIKISLKFVPKVWYNNIPSLVQIMAWRRIGDKALSEPMMVNLLTHICVTRPQWVNIIQCKVSKLHFEQEWVSSYRLLFRVESRLASYKPDVCITELRGVYTCTGDGRQWHSGIMWIHWFPLCCHICIYIYMVPKWCCCLSVRDLTILSLGASGENGCRSHLLTVGRQFLPCGRPLPHMCKHIQ